MPNENDNVLIYYKFFHIPRPYNILKHFYCSGNIFYAEGAIIHQHRKRDVSCSKHTNEAETLPQIPVSAFSQGLVVLLSLTLKTSSL